MNYAKITMASALVLAMAAPAYAQTYGSPYRPTDDYQRAQRNYEYQQDQYERSRDQYLDRRDDWRAQRAEYERRMRDWEVQRAAYDARWGYGAYARRYPAPQWDETRHVVIVTHAAPSTDYYGRSTTYVAPSANYYGRNTTYVAPADCNNNGAVAGAVIGALAGGVLGSNMAHHNRGTGTVLGALVGGGAGAAVGHAHDSHKCDERGAYYSYSDTVPYQTPSGYREERYSEYQRMGCRLAPAPVSDADYRYVRVCPDSDGRYRITG